MTDLSQNAQAIAMFVVVALFRIAGFALTASGAMAGIRVAGNFALRRPHAVAGAIESLLTAIGGVALMFMSGVIVATVVDGMRPLASVGDWPGVENPQAVRALLALVIQLCICVALLGVVWQALVVLFDSIFNGGANWGQVGPRLLYLGLALGVCVAAPAIVSALRPFLVGAI